MNSQVVIYTNSNGYKEFRRVPVGSSPTTYGQGVWLGPPNLENLNLSKKQKLEISNFLVDQGVILYKNLLGKKRLLLTMLVGIGFKEPKAIQIRNEIIGIYQKELVELSLENE